MVKNQQGECSSSALLCMSSPGTPNGRRRADMCKRLQVKDQGYVLPSLRRSEEIRYSDCYFKVPADQYKANPDAYVPSLFSFGLYHAVIANDGKDGASMFEDSFADNGWHQTADAVLKEYRDACNEGDHLKLLTARALLTDDVLGYLVALIQKHDSEVRKLYIQMPPIKLNGISPRSLALRLALDGITIVASALLPEDGDIDSPLIYPIARLSLSDAILLENQVPTFILWYTIKALKMSTPSTTEVHSLQEETVKLHEILEWYREHASPFPNFTRKKPPDNTLENPLLHYIYDYLTDADTFGADPQQQVSTPITGQNSSLHPRKIDSKNLLPTNMIKSTDMIEDHNSSSSKSSLVHELEDHSLPTASRLARCGVEFRACDAGFRGIGFLGKGAVLSIPRIAVSDTTVRSLHNLLAYEATARYPTESFVISFVHFMDRLIDTEEDVHVLVDAGVIRNVLGSHAELAFTWNKLCSSVSCRMTKKDNNIMAQLEALAKKRWRRWRASLKEKYWEKQPWLIGSIVVAVILLLLSFLQTFYTIKD